MRMAGGYFHQRDVADENRGLSRLSLAEPA
jgi:hypothetical protein